eukprot:Tamp_13950.p1 GENE.Tamp_13950~~Tamp_13950.p1  ORF type:complete len:190 (-),score=16.11 Tamp_13950:382-951(-)
MTAGTHGVQALLGQWCPDGGDESSFPDGAGHLAAALQAVRPSLATAQRARAVILRAILCRLVALHSPRFDPRFPTNPATWGDTVQLFEDEQEECLGELQQQWGEMKLWPKDSRWIMSHVRKAVQTTCGRLALLPGAAGSDTPGSLSATQGATTSTTAPSPPTMGLAGHWTKRNVPGGWTLLDCPHDVGV